MRQLFKRMTALLCSGLSLTGLCVTENTAAENKKTYNVTFRIHGEGTVKLENDAQGESVLESGEKTLTLDPGTFVKVTAETNETEVEQDEKTEDDSVITIAVSTAGGIELEPVTMGRGSAFTREITVTEIDKVVDITFGSSAPGIARAARVLVSNERGVS